MSKQLKDWELVKEDKEKGLAVLQYTGDNFLQKHLDAAGISHNDFKKATSALKQAKTDAFQASSDALVNYLANNKDIAVAKGKICAGLNKSDTLLITVTREKETRVVGKDETFKKTSIKVKDNTTSSNISKAVIRNCANEATKVLIK